MNGTINGIVVKVTEKVVVLLCDNGSFKNVPLPQGMVPQIGQSYTYQEEPKKRKWAYSFRYASVASVFLFAAIVYFLLPTEQKSAYVMALDINPSIEMVTDKSFIVLELIGRNEDGQKVVDQIDGKSKDGFLVIEEIVEEIIEQGYLQESEDIHIYTAVVALTEEAHSKTEEVEQLIHHILTDRDITAAVTVTDESKELYEVARKEQVSIQQLKERAKPKIERKGDEPKQENSKRGNKNNGQIEREMKREKAEENSNVPAHAKQKKEEQPAREEPPGHEKRNETPAKNGGKVETPRADQKREDSRSKPSLPENAQKNERKDNRPPTPKERQPKEVPAPPGNGNGPQRDR